MYVMERARERARGWSAEDNKPAAAAKCHRHTPVANEYVQLNVTQNHLNPLTKKTRQYTCTSVGAGRKHVLTTSCVSCSALRFVLHCLPRSGRSYQNPQTNLSLTPSPLLFSLISYILLLLQICSSVRIL